jgi:hypothetical protein
MIVAVMVVWPPKVKGKSWNNRPSPPPIVISRRRRRWWWWWWWSGVIPDHLSRRTTDFFYRFLYQLSILPNPLPHFPAIGVICPFGNGFNCMAAFIIINHRLAILGCISGRLIILIYRISNQGTDNGSCSQPD